MNVAEPIPLDQLRAEMVAWGPMASIPNSGRAYQMSKPTAYAHARAGTFPVPVHRIGSRYYVLTADVARSLGIDPALLLEPVAS